MSFHFNLSSSEEESSDEFVDDGNLTDSGKFNFGSDAEGGTIQDNNGGNGDDQMSKDSASARATSSPFFAKNSDAKSLWRADSDQDADDDSVDWEDAEDAGGESDQTDREGSKINGSSNETDASTAVPPIGAKRKLPSRDITLDFSAPDNGALKDNSTAKKKRKRKNLNKIRHLPQDLADLVIRIHRSHMLTLSARALLLSKCCCDEELMHLAHSTIPTEILVDCAALGASNPPPMSLVTKIALWFFTFINEVEQRRTRIRQENARLGAPQYQGNTGSSRRRGRGWTRKAAKGDYGQQKGKHGAEGLGSSSTKRLADIIMNLSPSNDQGPAHDEELVLSEIGGAATPHEKAQIFISLLRSLGWRVRYVAAFQPASRELTVDHPIFATSMTDLFHLVLSDSSTKTGSAARKRGMGNTTAIDPASEMKDEKQGERLSRSKEPTGSALAWIEILCGATAPRSSYSSSSPPNAKEQPKARWIHIDVHRNLIDRPGAVESILSMVQAGYGDGSHSVSPKSRSKRTSVSYVLAVEHTPMENRDDVHTYARLTDVTRRYSAAWSQSLRLRGATGQQIAANRGACLDSWWDQSLRKLNRLSKRKARKFLDGATPLDQKGTPKKGTRSTPALPNAVGHDAEDGIIVIDDGSGSDGEAKGAAPTFNGHVLEQDEHADAEKEELLATAASEAIPTSKAAFKKHPLYVIKSELNSTEVLHPDAKKRFCGVFKGQLIFRRSDVSVAQTAKKWPYKGRRVRDEEVARPTRKVKARKRAAPSNFRALTSYGVTDTNEQSIDPDTPIPDGEDSGMDQLYGVWQTEEWSPAAVGPSDPIPVNEYRNVELALMNPGLVHLELARISKVAKRLGIPYAPCLLGFEGHGGNRTPTIRGIVVHEHNAELLREAHTEWESQQVELEHTERRRRVHRRWKRLILGMQTKERLDREYGGEGG